MKTKMRLRYEAISNALSGHPMSRMQEYEGLTMTLEKHSISQSEFLEWLRFIRAEGAILYVNDPKLQAQRKDTKYRCPDCGAAVEIFEVNTMPCNMVGEDFMSMFSCSIFDCGWTSFSEKPVGEWINLLGKFNGNPASDMVSKTKSCGGCGNK